MCTETVIILSKVHQWRFQNLPDGLSIEGSKGGSKEAPPSNFFHFHAVFRKIGQNNRLPPPPLGNPGFATGFRTKTVHSKIIWLREELLTGSSLGSTNAYIYFTGKRIFLPADYLFRSSSSGIRSPPTSRPDTCLQCAVQLGEVWLE